MRDLRGDLHMHTTATDGKDDLETMVRAARDAGLEYIAITDHSKALAMANGLDERRALEHAARIRALDGRIDGIRVLAGIECDILPDGSMDLADELPGAARHRHRLGAFGHPSGGAGDDGARCCARSSTRSWTSSGIPPAACCCVASRPAPTWNAWSRPPAATEWHSRSTASSTGSISRTSTRGSARERGVKLVISSDAHSTGALAWKKWGVLVARRAWAAPADVLNTLPFDAFRRALRRQRATT